MLSRKKTKKADESLRSTGQKALTQPLSPASAYKVKVLFHNTQEYDRFFSGSLPFEAANLLKTTETHALEKRTPQGCRLPLDVRQW